MKSVWPQGATLEHMLDHFAGQVGIEHVGLVLDFTEAYQDALKAGKPRDLSKVPKWRWIRPDIFEFAYPAGPEGIALLPNVSHGMRERGHGDADIVAVLGGNWLRQLRESAG